MPVESAEETMGERLRRAMARSRVKNPELAQVADVDPATVSRWRSDRQTPSDAELSKVAAHLDVSAAWLRYGERGPGATVREPASGYKPPRHARNLPLSVREYLIELRRQLTRADVPDEAIDEAIELLRSPEVFSFFVGGAAREFPESDVLANVKTFAEESIIPTLRRRGYKL